MNLTQPNLLAFAQTSQALENTGVGASLARLLTSTVVPTWRGRLDPGDRAAAMPGT